MLRNMLAGLLLGSYMRFENHLPGILYLTRNLFCHRMDRSIKYGDLLKEYWTKLVLWVLLAAFLFGFLFGCSLYFWSAPSSPNSVSASDGTYSDKIAVSWSSSSGATSYKVYRATSAYGTYLVPRHGVWDIVDGY